VTVSTAIDYDPFRADVREDPQPWYRRLRDEAPVYRLPGYDAWALSRFEDIWSCSSDPAFSAATGTAPAQVLTRDQPVTPMINVMDPPEHTRLRAAIRKCFLPRQLRAVEPELRALFEGLVDEALERGECDAVQDLASRLSVHAACRAIGLPVEDGRQLETWVKRFFAHDPDRGGMLPEGLAALEEMTAYCLDRVRERRRNPSDGPQALDALVRFRTGADGTGAELPDDVAASHVTMLVIGGSETFPKTFANGVVRLAEYPDQRRLLERDPKQVPAAYDEILRYDMPTQFLCRRLVRDVELRGERMREGDAVMFLFASANRDEREFEDPDTFDVTRRPPRILSFGAGTHACLGTHVARLEGKITFETLLARAPTYEVDLDGAERLRTEFVQGFAKLPIRLRP
jgi:cytochrome P450